MDEAASTSASSSSTSTSTASTDHSEAEPGLGSMAMSSEDQNGKTAEVDTDMNQQQHDSWHVGDNEAGPSHRNGDSRVDENVQAVEDDLGVAHDDGIDPSDSIDPLDVMDEDEGGGEAIMSDGETGPGQEGKRVKVYELRDSSWFDRGTGYCKGIYDDSQDLALLIVESEEEGVKAVEEGEGGFLKEELLLTARVEKEDIYVRQQDTLIVWTEPGTNLDIALSFQDTEGCEDIWQFIAEVQRHLNNLPADMQAPSSSSPVSGSPVLGLGSVQMPGGETRTTWEAPTLSNIKQQEMWLRMQAKSQQGRERAVEHIIGEDYIKQLTVVFEQAEDLESLGDLHALCSLMQTILMFNDNTLLEYILQDDVFMGVIGIFEYDPDFPTLKASYRQFFQDVAKFRQVVEIQEPSIRTKIHQLFRVQYLRDVVLARMLDDGTFGILNGFVFFTQVDIINYIQNNDAFLNELLSDFRDDRPRSPEPGTAPQAPEPLDERRRDIVLLLDQLMILGKGIQLPNRLALYRNLIDKGVLFVVEWAFRRPEAQLLHAGAEILTLAVELDVSAVRVHILKEDEAKRRTLIMEMIQLLQHTTNLGLLSQVGDSLRTLLDTSAEEGTFLQRKEGPISENFVQMFYENCVQKLYLPLLQLPEIRQTGPKPAMPRERIALLHLLTELLAASVLNQSQLHRASYYVLSNPISKRIVSLLYLKDKPLRHAALRFIKSCLKLQNHFINRFFIKNQLLLPVIDTLTLESTKDNMLSSACMEVFDLIRRDNAKPIINHLFDTYRDRFDALSERPYLRQLIFGLTIRWQQNNEPPPPPVQPPEAESSKAWERERKSAAQEEDYFNASDDEEGEEETGIIGPVMPKAGVAAGGRTGTPLRKRRRNNADSPAGMAKADGDAPTTTTTSPVSRPGAPSPGKMAGGRMGLVDYDDGSDDSEGSSGAQSPIVGMKPISMSLTGSPKSAGAVNATPDEKLEEDLGDVALKMRAKRAREEEEEEGFAGLLGRAKVLGGGGVGGLDEAATKEEGREGKVDLDVADVKEEEKVDTADKADQGDKGKEEKDKKGSAGVSGGKKLKLSLSGAFKKLSK